MNDSPIPFPRPGSAEYDFLLESDTKKKKMLKRWKNINKFITIPLYRANIIPLLVDIRYFFFFLPKEEKAENRE